MGTTFSLILGLRPPRYFASQPPCVPLNKGCMTIGKIKPLKGNSHD